MNCASNLKNNTELRKTDNDINSVEGDFEEGYLTKMRNKKALIRRRQRLRNEKPGTYRDFSGVTEEMADKRDDYIRDYKPFVDVTEQEIKDIKQYATSQYNRINDVLRFGKSSRGEIYENTKDKIINIQKAISKNAVHDSLKVYRGAKLPPDVMAKVKEGAVFRDEGFVSTSLERRVAKQFAGSHKKKPLSYDRSVIMKIDVKKGSKGIFSQAAKSDLTGESELILQAGSRFRIKKITETADHFNVDAEYLGL